MTKVKNPLLSGYLFMGIFVFLGSCLIHTTAGPATYLAIFPFSCAVYVAYKTIQMTCESNPFSNPENDEI